MNAQYVFRAFLWMLAAILAGQAVAAAAPAPCTQVVPPARGGAFVQTGDRVDGYYLAGNTIIDYFGGGPKDYRNWFVFNLPVFPGPLVSAELRLAAGTTISAAGSETWVLHQISADTVSNLLNPPRIIDPSGIPRIVPSPAIYADLGDGAVFGSTSISTSQNARVYYDPGAPVFVPFTPAGLAALTAAPGGRFAFGGVVSTLDGNTNTPDLVFFNTAIGVWPVELVLNFGAGAPASDAPLLRGGSATLRGDPTTILLAGDSLTVAGQACGQAPVGLQWLVNGAALPGETNSLLYRSFIAPSDSGIYQLRTSNTLGTSTSAPVDVLIQALTIFTDLTPRTVTEGDYPGMAVTVATYLPITFEWRRDGVLLPAETNYYLNFPATLASAGDYQMIARNSYGSVTSAVAHLTVLLRPPTVWNDIYDTVVAAGTYLSLGVTVVGTQPISYQWFKNNSPIPGQTSNTITFPSIGFGDAGQYSVVMSNAAGTTHSRTAVVTVRAFTGIVGPNDTSVLWGDPAVLYIAAFGVFPQTFQWYFNGQALPAATNSALYFSAVTPGDAGRYYVAVTNAYGFVISPTVTLTVMEQEPIVGAYLSSYEPTDEGPPKLVLGTRAEFTAVVSAGPPAGLQWQHDGVDISGATNEVLVLPALAPADAGNYSVVATNIFGTNVSDAVFIEVIPVPATVEIWISSYVQEPDLVLPQVAAGTYVIFDASLRGSPPIDLQWQRDGVALPGETNSRLMLENLSDRDSGSYTLVASNSFAAVTSAPVSIVVAVRAPYFNLVPAVPLAVSGQTIVFRSVAGGTTPLRYQWRFRNVDLPGATNATLLLTPRGAADSGPYEVVVRNSAGEARATNELIVRPDSNLDHWKWRLPQPQGSRLKSVAWGDGRFVAVGQAGSVVTSTNGVDWTNVLIESDVKFDHVVRGNGLFLASGYAYTPTAFTPYFGHDPVGLYGITGINFSSPDGVHWTPAATVDDDYFSSVAFGNGVFVACGILGRAWVYTSVDGKSWTPRSNGPYGAYRVAWGGGTFLAFGGLGLYSSINGIDWTFIPQDEGFGLNELSYGNGLFVGFNTVYTQGQTVTMIHTSPDGTLWQAHLLTNFPYLVALGAGGGRFVGLAPQQGVEPPKGTLITSTDLETWTVVNTGANQELESLVFGAGQFVIVGEAGTLVRSADGVSWNLQPVANAIDYYGLAGNGQLMVAAGDNGTIQTSTDGQTWTLRSTPGSRNLHGAAYGNGLFVATGRRGQILTSPNGVAWTHRESGVTNYLERVLYANGRWVAVGEHGDMSTSVDGLTWTPLSTGAPFADHEGIAYGNGTWVAAGGYTWHDSDDGDIAISTIYVSSDGVNWSARSFDAGKRLRDVTFADGRFVAVGNDRLIATSADGTAWSRYFLPTLRVEDNFRRVTHALDRWVVVGNDGRMISTADPTDASRWQDHLSHTSQNLHDILATPDGGFVAVGNNGMLLQSSEPRPRITQLRPVNGGIAIDFTTGLVSDPVRLEASPDLQSWETIATNVHSPQVVPLTAGGARFFRLVTP